MKLPTTKTGIKRHLYEYSALIYGNPKIGKSTFCSEIDNALFLATEPGLNAINAFEIEITRWNDMRDAYRLIKQGQHQFKAVIIDTIDIAYSLCAEETLEKLGIIHESDAQFGKAYKMINKEFEKFLNALGSLPYGLFLISHSKTKELDRKKGRHTKIVPTLPESAQKIVDGFVDSILYFEGRMVRSNDPNTDNREERVIRTSTTRFYDAGSRLHGLPESIPLDYREFEKAFKVAIAEEIKKEEQSQANNVAQPTPTNVQQPSRSNNVSQISPMEAQLHTIRMALISLVDPGRKLEKEELRVRCLARLSFLTDMKIKNIEDIPTRTYAQEIIKSIAKAKLAEGKDDAGFEAANGGA